MKKSLQIIILLGFCVQMAFAARNSPLIIDHNCTDLTKIPDNMLIKARQTYRVAYGHKIQGSQIVTGMLLLKEMENSKYLWDEYGGQGEGQQPFLCLKDGIPEGQLNSLGLPSWLDFTQKLLNPNTDKINVVMWDWGPYGTLLGSEGIMNHLRKIDSLEKKYGQITFIYMTGYLDEGGETGRSTKNNEIIRNFCLENNKVLFDFADLESYDPEGNYFLDKGCDAILNYDGGNWATEYCERNPSECDSCACYLTPCINCQQKAKAFWWMMARLAGWGGDSNIKPDLILEPYTLNFDKVGFEQGVLDVELKNTGKTYLQVKNIEIVGKHDTVFGFSEEPVVPMIINAKSKKLLKVYCNPPNINGKYNAEIKITTNNGEFTIEMEGEKVGGIGVDDFDNNIFLRIIPEIAQDEFKIYYNLPDDNQIDMKVFNLNGIQMPGMKLSGYKMNGYYEEKFTTEHLQPGIYFVKFTYGTTTLTRKIVVVK